MRERNSERKRQTDRRSGRGDNHERRARRELVGRPILNQRHRVLTYLCLGEHQPLATKNSSLAETNSINARAKNDWRPAVCKSKGFHQARQCLSHLTTTTATTTNAYSHHHRNTTTGTHHLHHALWPRYALRKNGKRRAY